MSYISDAYNSLSNVSWGDYGFIRNDLSLFSMFPTLKALAFALWERVWGLRNKTGYGYDGICATTFNSLARFKPMTSYNWHNVRQSGYYDDTYNNFQYFIDLAFREFEDLNLSSGACFINEISRNPLPLVIADCMDEVVEELNNEGFVCSLFPLKTNWSTLANCMTINNNKNFPIQRKRLFDKCRYFYSSYREDSPVKSSNSKIGLIYRIGGDYYNTVGMAIDALSSERYYRALNTQSRMPVILQFSVSENKIRIDDFPEYFVVDKAWLDNIMTLYPNITNPLMTFEFNNSLFTSFYKWHYINLSNVVTYNNTQYYVIDVSPTTDEIISIMQSELSSGSDGNRTTRIRYVYNTYLKQFYDGADFFKFIDIA